MDEAHDDPFDACARCGTPLRHDRTYPVTSEREGDDFWLYSFCDAECQRAWREDDDAPDDSPSEQSAD